MTKVSERFTEPKNEVHAFFGGKKKAEIYEKEKEAFKDGDVKNCCKYGWMSRGHHCITYSACTPLELTCCTACFLCTIPGALCTTWCGLGTALRCIVCCGDEQSGQQAATTASCCLATSTCFAMGSVCFGQAIVNTIMLPFNLLCPEACGCQHHVNLCLDQTNEKLTELGNKLSMND